MRDKVPVYEDMPTEDKQKKKGYSEVDRVNAIGSWSIKAIAMFGAFVLALVYDGYWLYVFFGIAAVLLGVELRYRWILRSNAPNEEPPTRRGGGL